MNRHIHPDLTTATAWFSTLFMAALTATVAPAAPSAKPVVAHRSDFVLPMDPQQGRDPFYPTSMRPYRVPTVKTNVTDMSSLVLKGISGPPDGLLAIINNQTFGVGDEGDVAVPGGRIHIRCLEISTNSAVVEADGERHELRYLNKP
jgi:hypothetical protein